MVDLDPEMTALRFSLSYDLLNPFLVLDFKICIEFSMEKNRIEF